MIIRASKIDTVDYNKDTHQTTFTTFELRPITDNTGATKMEFITLSIPSNSDQYAAICNQLFDEDEWIDTDIENE